MITQGYRCSLTGVAPVDIVTLRLPGGRPAFPGRDDVLEPDIRPIASRVVYQDQWITLRRDEIERADGSRGTYAVVVKRDFALVIPAEHGGFHLVEEYHYPLGRRTWGFPQGGFPAGQDGSPEDLARLELAEETGLRASHLSRLGYLNAAHGITGQGCHVFLATGLSQGAHRRETTEQDMRHYWVTRQRFKNMIRSGSLTDDASVAAYTLLVLHEECGG
jgi:8-oxo-dGTP pyrophosphatase MutT (NUDIX family)